MSKQADLQEWQRLAEEELGTGAAPLAGVETPEGLLRKPLYTEADLDDWLRSMEQLADLVGLEPV